MIIKVNMLLDVDAEGFKQLYEGDDRNITTIIAEGLETSINCDEDPVKVILIETSME
jgi:hypothetical protein